MGILENEKADKRDKRNAKRGSVNNTQRLKTLGKGRSGADWAEVEPKAISAVVIAACRVGGAVRFGYSRDGGAYSVGVYLEGDSNTLYCNGGDDVLAFLQEIYQFYDDTFMAQDVDKAP